MIRKPEGKRSVEAVRKIGPKVARIFTVSLLAAAGLMGYLLWSSYQDALTLARTTSNNLAWVLEARLDATLRRADTVLLGEQKKLENNPDLMRSAKAQDARPGIESEFNQLLEGFPEVSGLRVFDASGDLLYTSLPRAMQKVSVADRDYFLALKRDAHLQRFYSAVITSRISGAPVFVLAYPVRDKRGQFLGIVSAAISLSHFEALLRSIELGENSVISIRRSDSFALVLRWPALPGEVNQVLPAEHPNRAEIESGKRIVTTDTTAHTDGTRRIFSLHALENHPFYVLVGIAHQDMLQGWYRRLAVVLIASGWVLALSSALALSLRRSEAELIGAYENLQQTEHDLLEKEQRFRTLFDEAPVGHALNRLEDGHFIAINQMFSDITGYSRESLNRMSYWALTPDRYAADEAKQLELLKQTGRYGPYEKHYIHKDGHWVPVRLQGCIVTAPGGEKQILSVVENISEQKQAEERIHLLASVFQYSGEAILISDRDNNIVEVNTAFTRMTGYTWEDVAGKNPRLLSSGRNTAEEYADMWHHIQEQGQWQGELWDRHKDGHVYPKWITISTIHDSQGNVTHYIANFTDITEHKAAEERIHYIAHHDALTKLPNRLNLQGRLEQALASARRGKERLAVLFVDLDRFKVINDTLGHHIGDDLLMEVADRLRQSVRDSDVVARLGGDEFVVVLTGLAAEDVAPIARKMLAHLGEPYLLTNHELHSTPSIGISLFPEDGDDVDTLMKNADTAMYHAKSAGRNNYQFFRSGMNEAASERLLIENNLRQALARKEFVLHYQPQIDAQSGAVVCVEALIRWQHPEQGMIPPLRFIPVAEETGLIGPIGQWVLEEAMGQLRAWRSAGIEGLRMAVNLSASQLRDPDLGAHIHARLLQHNLPGSCLELEITESVAMHDPAHSATMLQSLHELGVGLAIDDFGTGYSSLAYLKQLPLDRLKLDRSFVTDIEHDANDAAICTATISLAHSLHLAVVAEGVETPAQMHYLKSLGCDLLQGYLFSEPLPADECLAFVATAHRERAKIEAG